METIGGNPGGMPPPPYFDLGDAQCSHPPIFPTIKSKKNREEERKKGKENQEEKKRKKKTTNGPFYQYSAISTHRL